MELSKQVCSLELARKLKEAGVGQESLFYWCTISGTNQADLRPAKSLFGKELELGHDYAEEISAFNLAELIHILQSVAKDDIIVAWSDDKVADHLAEQLCIKLQNLKESVGFGHMQ